MLFSFQILYNFDANFDDFDHKHVLEIVIKLRIINCNVLPYKPARTLKGAKSGETPIVVADG